MDCSIKLTNKLAFFVTEMRWFGNNARKHVASRLRDRITLKITQQGPQTIQRGPGITDEIIRIGITKHALISNSLTCGT
ncbi:hypothetical protein WJ23_36110 [Burkholderia lata]|uniref:Uncharacterized protein n=1 Tax=Burkholderia contaminans TaxID=488447 RepID=A0A6P2WTU7_9BURK|nr:hypothetical protein WJ23_36110 [Burkholderia lata]VWD00274.1 hypothetical protein BCO71033_01738 [Burkholderia contaminans]